MKKLFTQNLGYRLAALVLAILLFAYVKTDHLTSTRVSGADSSSKTALMSNKTTTISMPVDLDVDTSKYVVSGYREKVKVTLSGSSAVITALTNTRNFKVYLDLQDYHSGTHTVKYKVDGLGKDIKYQINPDDAKIKIAKRKTKEFKINYRYDTNMVKEGYVMGDLKSSTTTVQATGAANDIDRIAEIVADININGNTTKNVSAHPSLQALDANGNIVNVVITPQTVDVTIPVNKTEKKTKTEDSASTSSSSSASSTSSSIDDGTVSDDSTSASNSTSSATVSDDSSTDEGQVESSTN
jgi:YbbR domain-containing protein